MMDARPGPRDPFADGRHRRYLRLVRRNHLVGVLRILVPVVGATVLGALVLQIVISSSVPDFGIGRISVDRDAITVETPQYSGVSADGSTYTVRAHSARARLNAVTVIDLVDASLLLRKLDGVEMFARAEAAVLESALEQVTVKGVTEVGNSLGASGTLVGVFLDAPAETLTASGPVHLRFPDGMVLDAKTLDYSGDAAIWSFSGVTLTIPATSGNPTRP